MIRKRVFIRAELAVPQKEYFFSHKAFEQRKADKEFYSSLIGCVHGRYQASWFRVHRFWILECLTCTRATALVLFLKLAAMLCSFALTENHLKTMFFWCISFSDFRYMFFNCCSGTCGMCGLQPLEIHREQPPRPHPHEMFDVKG